MSNRLINEQSHYLLQHAHNPVDWYPWGDEAFRKARLENKPVIVSIGYAACHWCHVMERESFENEETAAYMNEHFVCVKVDREEHPDVDHLYMDAVQAINGNGGWPLNVFTTPDKVPFYGGTYYPPAPAYSRPSWRQLMERMQAIWQHQQEEVVQQAEQMVNYLTQASQGLNIKPPKELTTAICKGIASGIMRLADKEKGGFGNAPKFPGTMAISFLLQHYYFTGDEACLRQALLSLEAMAAGGIYDHLGGGFARYSTDKEWLAPHFEKMLYDNALLILSYCDAYAITQKESYRTIVEETIAFVGRELKHPTGGYYCALDADSEGVEGKFYTWTRDEFAAVAGDDTAMLAMYFGVTEHGNWEESNILHEAVAVETVAAQFSVSEAHLQEKLKSVKRRLLELRGSRIRPLTDDKCLLSWNALMSIALTRAGVVFSNDAYLQLAATHMLWMQENFRKDGEWLHCWKNGTARIVAKLDDYSYLAQAMLQLASASGATELLSEATGICELVIDRFAHEKLFFYYSPAHQADIPVRKVDLYDGATPSANAVMADNLWICGMCSGRHEWVELSQAMVAQMSDDAVRNGYSYGYWAQLVQKNVAGRRTVVFTGAGAKAGSEVLRANLLPHVYPIFAEKEETSLAIFENKNSPDYLSIFVCSENECLPPIGSAERALEVVDKRA